ncbi:MAG: hypothetical protein EXQ85_00475 [Alphaproteobacteria bacterium]|nr:hypothetical protein [Alphaproteobacteria bacterium]
MTMQSGMERERLKQILAAYGGDERRWPEAERLAAQALLARMPEARAWRESDRRLDAVLDSAAVPTVSPALRRRLLQPADGRAPWFLRIWLQPVWRPAVMVAVAVMGLYLGMAVPQGITRLDDGDVLELVADAADGGLEEMDLE